jgi:hypothetical protein
MSFTNAAFKLTYSLSNLPLLFLAPNGLLTIVIIARFQLKIDHVSEFLISGRSLLTLLPGK